MQQQQSSIDSTEHQTLFRAAGSWKESAWIVNGRGGNGAWLIWERRKCDMERKEGGKRAGFDDFQAAR